MNRLSVIILFALVLVFPATALATTWIVPDDHTTVQAAIDAAADGDLIYVEPGTYAENIEFGRKRISVVSTIGPEKTILDGMMNGSVVVFEHGEGENQQLVGFTIRNGDAYDGGGIYIDDASPVIRENIITANRASGTYGKRGGGIYCINGSPVIEHNRIVENRYGHHGGGIYCGPGAAAIIRNNTIQLNHAMSYGGGILCEECTCTIVDNLILENSAHHGAGIYCYTNAVVEIVNNRIEGNGDPHQGGGISATDCQSLLISGNEIIGNQGDEGAGIRTRSSAPMIVNNVIAGNFTPDSWEGEGGGCSFYEDSALLVNNTIYDNHATFDGGGIALFKSEVRVVNCILWNNSAGLKGPGAYLKYDADETTELSISYTDLKDGISSILAEPGTVLNWGDGMIDADPFFLDAASNDLHLLAPSPCIDAGDPGVAYLPEFDIEGDPRQAQGHADLGADEFFCHCYYTGVAMPGETIDLICIGDPGSMVILFLGFELLDPPFSSMYGLWHLELPVFTIPLWALDANGLLILPTPFPEETPAPVSLYCQAFMEDVLSNLCTVEVVAP